MAVDTAVASVRQKRVVGAVVCVNTVPVCYAVAVLAAGVGSVKGAAGLALGSVFATAIAALAGYVRGWWVLLPLGVLAALLAYLVYIVILFSEFTGHEM